MCGIAAIINTTSNNADLCANINLMLEKIEHRGDISNKGEIKLFSDGALGTNRLAIVDRDNGSQPICNEQGNIWIIFNGEIYNYKEIRQILIEKGHVFKTETDTETIILGYEQWGKEVVEHLDGAYAFVIYNSDTKAFFAARDHIGIKPLYYAFDSRNQLFFASEKKSIIPLCTDIQELGPGCRMDQLGIDKYFELSETESDLSVETILPKFRSLFTEAVKKRIDTDLPIAVMFSGGIDSTLVLHIARKVHPDVTAITIGFPGAEDIDIAKKYCDEFGVRHEICILNKEKLIEIIPKIVYYAEFFESIDVMDTCIGYFGYEYAKKLGIKVALCGEGSDELLAGYDLFAQFDNPDELMRYRVNNLYRTDIQRVDRSSMMNRVEARVPFMDKEFLKFSYQIPMSMKLKNGESKWILREAFRGDLPDRYLNRKKVRMPDGSGLQNLLYEYAGKQKNSVSETVSEKLGLETPQEKYFMGKYLEMGFPVPRERYRKVLFDYSPHGYFNFIAKTQVSG